LLFYISQVYSNVSLSLIDIYIYIYLVNRRATTGVAQQQSKNKRSSLRNSSVTHCSNTLQKESYVKDSILCAVETAEHAVVDALRDEVDNLFNDNHVETRTVSIQSNSKSPRNSSRSRRKSAMTLNIDTEMKPSSMSIDTEMKPTKPIRWALDQSKSYLY
jgi:hypothetical protein